MKGILRPLAALLLLVLVVVAVLLWVHVSRRTELPIPDVMSLTAPEEDLPVAIAYVNTASQRVLRTAVLDQAYDPDADAHYVMSHLAFVLRWGDGRILLIDAGMTPEAALEFGEPLRWLAGADDIQPHGSTATLLGDAAARVGGILFTHQHIDHVGGIGELCRVRSSPLPVFMTATQAAQTNYTTRRGRALIDAAGCARVTPLPEGAVNEVPGFPGVAVMAVGGHTPCTQLILAWVNPGTGPQLYAFVGDIVNHIEAINYNISKPFMYRLVVAEDDERLADWRVLLRRLRDERGATLLVSHDQLAIEATGVKPYAEGSL